MALYKLINNGVLRTTDNLSIPNDPLNRHWQEYEAWIAEGNTADSEFTIQELLQNAQTAKISELTQTCSQQIISFTSSALGSEYTYPAKEGDGYYDQTNLNNAVAESLLPGLPTGWTTPIWCEDSSNNWSFINHTAAQVQQVLQDFVSAKNTARTKLKNLTAQVNAATTVSAVNAITW